MPWVLEAMKGDKESWSFFDCLFVVKPNYIQFLNDKS